MIKSAFYRGEIEKHAFKKLRRGKLFFGRKERRVGLLV
jgi:hypothetical protein